MFEIYSFTRYMYTLDDYVLCIVIHLLYVLSYNVVCTVTPQYLKLKMVQDILGCEIKKLKKVLKHRLKFLN